MPSTYFGTVNVPLDEVFPRTAIAIIEADPTVLKNVKKGWAVKSYVLSRAVEVRGRPYVTLVYEAHHNDDSAVWKPTPERLVRVAGEPSGGDLSSPGKEHELAGRRAELIRLYEHECRVGHGSVIERKRVFVEQYKNGAWPDLLRDVGSREFPTFERWRKKLNDTDGDPLALMRHYGTASKGRTKITGPLDKILQKYALQHRGGKVSDVIRLVRAEFEKIEGPCAVSDATLRRRVNDIRTGRSSLKRS